MRRDGEGRGGAYIALRITIDIRLNHTADLPQSTHCIHGKTSISLVIRTRSVSGSSAYLANVFLAATYRRQNGEASAVLQDCVETSHQRNVAAVNQKLDVPS